MAKMQFMFNKFRLQTGQQQQPQQKYALPVKITADTFTKKASYNSIIPLNIFQTWDNKHHLPRRMKIAMDRTKKMNPEFHHQVFTDQECLKFIQDNFDAPVAAAYRRIIPSAFRADLWRYCVLYIKGGIYMDVKYVPNNNFSFMELTEAEHFVLDANKRGIYNAFMVALPKNPALLDAIHKIVDNVKKRNHGRSLLDVTGPEMLMKYILPQDARTDMHHAIYANNAQFRVVLYKGKHILKCYPGYKQEQQQTGGEHYSTLWQRRQVFRK
jgi:mannosyltransferase OCH1-like enzyme